MGVVYLGHDPRLDRRVAIKTISLHAVDPQALEDYHRRFRAEARSAARLHHPHIAAIHDFGTDAGMDYIVMEYIDGVDLKSRLAEGGGLTLWQVLQLTDQLLSALHYMHERKVIHRDVKPANLLLTREDFQVKLTDFGVAKVDSAHDDRTRSGLVGTPHYMAPEQIDGELLDARCDLFSTGVILYQLLTGRLPFDSANSFGVMKAIVGSPHPPMHELDPSVQALLSPVVDRALAKSRDDRFAGAGEFRRALGEAAEAIQDLAESQALLARRAPRERHATRVSTASGAGGTKARALRGGERAGDSGIELELELRLWEEIRGSSDAQDFEDFLKRFPSGAFAYQARKRRQRLLGLTTTGAYPSSRQGGAGQDEEPPALRNAHAIARWQREYYAEELVLRKRVETSSEQRMQQAVARGEAAPEAAEHHHFVLDLAVQKSFDYAGQLHFEQLDALVTVPSLLFNDAGVYMVAGPLDRSGHTMRFRQLLQASGATRLVATRRGSELVSAHFEMIMSHWAAMRGDRLLFDYNVVQFWRLSPSGWRICGTGALDFFSAQRHALLATAEPDHPQADPAMLDQRMVAFHRGYQAALRRGEVSLREPLFMRPFLIATVERLEIAARLDPARLPYAAMKGFAAEDYRWYSAAPWMRLLVVDYYADWPQGGRRRWSGGYLVKLGPEGGRVVAIFGLDADPTAAPAAD